ncbi:MAG: DEAD/DEAH box helicase [Ginsengibacter sp.]
MNKGLPTLLLAPRLITNGEAVISLLHIIRKNQSINITNERLTHAVIRKEFKNYPGPLENLLMKGSVEELEEQSNEMRRRYVQKKAGVGLDVFRSKIFVNYWHKIFEELRPYFSLIKWYYQKGQKGKSAYLTAPCSFSAFKPGLSFEVVKGKDGLQLKTYIVFTEQSFPLETFTRYHFFLIDKNEIFILSNKDYRTLEELANTDVAKYGCDPQEFARQILSGLENEYAIKRNQYIPEVEVTSPPVCRVLLTELSNSFLMLTPQWVYDGFLIDGSFNENTEQIRNGISYTIRRNKEVEEDFRKKLVSLHKNFANQRNGFFYLTFADAVKGQWFLKVYQQFLKANIELVGMDMLANFRYSPHLPETSMVLKKEEEEILVFEMEICFGKESIPLNELQKMLLAGQKAVMLKDGSLGMLGENWLIQYASIVKHGKINKKEIEVLRWMAVTEQGDTGGKPMLREALKKEWWERWQRWQSEDEKIYSLSQSLHATLRPYQQKGYEWLLLLQEIGAGACLADDMGLGKTVQAIAAIVYFIEKYPRSKNLIICPASLIYTWKEEFEKFAPSVNTMVYHGIGRQQEQLNDPDTGVIITTYSTMRNDVDAISSLPYGIVVLDESHNIKNPATQISQAVMRIKARFRMALSGTPVINNTFDLYSQLHFVVPGLFGSREFFRREYANPIDNFQDEEKIAALKKLTAPFILRRKKEQVAKDLPDKTETILWCSMNDAQKRVYEDILNNTRSSLFLEIKDKGLSKSKLSILQAMTRLRQVCSSPLLLPGDEYKTCTESVKTEVLMEELDHILGEHKVIVFSQFASMLHLLADECAKRGIDYYHFDGQTPPGKRTEMVNQFQKEDNKVHLFLISLKAGNTGLTLTAADYVFLFDPWWNTAVQDQAIDRTHRIGQTKNVFAYKMICKDTIEEKIVSLQQKKKKLSEDLVSADNGFVKSLTEEEVQYLFS